MGVPLESLSPYSIMEMWGIDTTMEVDLSATAKISLYIFAITQSTISRTDPQNKTNRQLKKGSPGTQSSSYRQGFSSYQNSSNLENSRNNHVDDWSMWNCPS
eukprot:CAMPEP_0172470452 /NCGR_PEP_ID=MMETSP1065-20121228/66389_1 /TAXON_ID=265537 /ORGANISM="Amphiprora paludosa, Strain CCMP125" /LENGTH=101 /DNA_ID=CAMNT_0013228387 /DNA_START=1 /DNA_END=306 /DNA_ORIENTATION=-